MVETILIVWTIVVGIPAFYGFFRNGVLLYVSFSIFERDESAYDRLPTANEMIFHPKHLHRWTTRQWMAYVEKSNG